MPNGAPAPRPAGCSSGGITALAEEMDLYGKDRDAPMREIFARLGDRWSLLILLLLRLTPARHGELRKLIAALSAEGAISQRMLTLRLRALERDGLVKRAVSLDVPPQVTYSLTVLGAELLGHVDPLMQWVRDRGADIAAARSAFSLADTGCEAPSD